MKKTMRIILVSAAGLVLIALAGIALALVLINPNDYKPKIESAILKATGRQIVLQGDISLSFFPRLGLDVGPAEILDDASFGNTPFARIENISISLPLLPLLQGRTEIASATATGLRLNLMVNERGQANWAATQPEQPTAPVKQRPAPSPSASAGSQDLSAFALNSLGIQDAAITYTDKRILQSEQIAVPTLTLTSLKAGETTTLDATASYSGRLPAPAALALHARFTLPRTLGEDIPFEIKGKLDDTSFAAKGTTVIPNPAQAQPFSLNGTVELDAITLDKYLASPQPAVKNSASGKPAKEAAPAPPQKPAENGDQALATTLRNLTLDLQCTAQAVTIAKVPVSDIRLSLTANKGLIAIKPASARIAGGPITIEAAVDAQGKRIQSAISGDWKNAGIGELIRAISGNAPLTGELSAAWRLGMTGISWPDAAKTLQGTASAVFKNGAMPQFALIPANIPGLPAKIMNLNNVQASGTWAIAKGIATNNDFAASATGLRASGKGSVNIPAQTLRYAIGLELPTLPELPNLTVLPAIISGPLSSPVYSIDQPALLRDTAKSLLDPSTKTGKEIQRGLGNLLKR